MQISCKLLVLGAVVQLMFFAQQSPAAALLTHPLLSGPGPTLRFADQQLPSPLSLITYGD
ncbi:MAG TPA: hypothetical protein VHZ55_02065 [Bryobacteraceae bacterium]|nr:hypothetical protein [Bryobacteraceae bacterium]